jgi:hypothetical protein
MRPLLTQECKNVSGGFIGFMLAAAELDLITCIPICIIGVAVIALGAFCRNCDSCAWSAVRAFNVKFSCK